MKEVQMTPHMAANPGLQMAEIITHATVSLDGQENAMRWLQKPNRQMGDRKPLDILQQGNPSDLQQLEDLLTALDYGMHS